MTNLLSRVTTAIQDNMVERVARVLCWEAGIDPDNEIGSEAYPLSPAWRNWQQDARAAIEAMREPTDEMVCAGFVELHNIASAHDSATGCYRAMIDSALSPLQPQSDREGK